MDESQAVSLLLKSAIPIDAIDQMLSPDLNFAVIWVDISERPDVQVLAEQEGMEDGFCLCTWFYENPGKRNMRIGLRIEMRQPVHFVLPLVFTVREYAKELTTMSEQGQFWIVPGLPPTHVRRTREMDAQAIITEIVAYSGQGLCITLEDHLITELREQLAEWKKGNG